MQPSNESSNESQKNGVAKRGDVAEDPVETLRPKTIVTDSVQEASTLMPTPQGLAVPSGTPLLFEEAETRLPALESSDKTQLPTANTWTESDYEGAKWGTYHRVVSVGTWQFGKLFHAEHLQLRRKVLLIVLASEWSAKPEIKLWFVETAKSLGSIQDPHLSAAVLEYGVHEDATYIATPLPGISAVEYYHQRTQRAVFPRDYDPICEAFIALMRGLTAIHQVGIGHGVIGCENLFLSNSAEGVRFLPFAGGLPQAAWFDLERKIPVQPTNAFSSDYQALALEFIRLLLGHGGRLSMPAKPSLRWLRRALPFISPKLAKLLIRMWRGGLRSQNVETTLDTLDVIRREILVPVSWSTRLYHLISELVMGFLILLLFLILVGIGIATISMNFSSGVAAQTPFASSPLVPLIFFIPWALLLAIHLFWEPAFNTTLARQSFQCQLIDNYDKMPAIWRRFARSFSRMGLWFIFYVVIWVSLYSQNQSNQALGFALFLTYLAPLLAMGLVYATAPLCGGIPFHDWISGTRWIQFRRVDDGHSIAISETQERNQTLLSRNPTDVAKDHEEAIGDIQLRRELGRGGMGTVYLGYDRVLNRSVAVKVTIAGEHESREAIERFRREAKLAANLDHPNITKVYRVGMWKNQPFMEMEYVDGETFQQIVKRDGSIPVHQAWDWILQAAIGLREAANQGIIHRDIKPANLMVSKEAMVKVMDFGISKNMEEERDSEAKSLQNHDAQWLARSIDPNPSLTRTGAMLGTPQYMSPEQARSGHADVRSDIYSLGLTLYYLLAGRPAFESPSVYDLLIQQCSEPPPPFDDHLLGEEQREVLDRMIAKRPEDRFQDYQQLIESIQATQVPEDRVPGRSRRTNACLIDLVVLSILYAGVFSVSLGKLATFVWIALSVTYLFGIPYILGGTVSHKLFRLVVQTRQGGSPHWFRSTCRQSVKYGPYLAMLYLMRSLEFLRVQSQVDVAWIIVLPLIVAFAISLVFWSVSFFVVAAWNSNSRAIHDLLAGTRIVYRPPGSKSKSRR